MRTVLLVNIYFSIEDKRINLECEIVGRYVYVLETCLGFKQEFNHICDKNRRATE